MENVLERAAVQDSVEAAAQRVWKRPFVEVDDVGCGLVVAAVDAFQAFEAERGEELCVIDGVLQGGPGRDLESLKQRENLAARGADRLAPERDDAAAEWLARRLLRQQSYGPARNTHDLPPFGNRF